jgi:hypothetical protein
MNYMQYNYLFIIDVNSVSVMQYLHSYLGTYTHWNTIKINNILVNVYYYKPKIMKCIYKVISLTQDQISFSILSDVCLPVSLLILVVVWGYQLNAMTIDTDSGDNHTMLLVCGIGLIVVSGTACVYIAIRTSVMRPEVEVTTFLLGEVVIL